VKLLVAGLQMANGLMGVINSDAVMGFADNRLREAQG
jgi:hypothetical protein